MTWPDRIAAVVLIAFALLILTDQHKHRSTTKQQHPDPQDGEPRS